MKLLFYRAGSARQDVASVGSNSEFLSLIWCECYVGSIVPSTIGSEPPTLIDTLVRSAPIARVTEASVLGSVHNLQLEAFCVGMPLCITRFPSCAYATLHNRGGSRLTATV